eukprot:3594550-Prymnesium_polylepis.2
MQTQDGLPTTGADWRDGDVVELFLKVLTVPTLCTFGQALTRGRRNAAQNGDEVLPWFLPLPHMILHGSQLTL